MADDIVAHFVTSIRERRRPWCDTTVGLHIAEQQTMAYRSAQTGQTIDLTTTFVLPWEREPSLMSLADD